MIKLMTGDEKFTNNKIETDLSIGEMWRWKYSDIYDLHEVIAEYIVEKTLKLKRSQNIGEWKLFDIKYKNKRIEVKETSYFHSWNKPGQKRSEQRRFGITKACPRDRKSDSKKERQNDLYVFCLNTGYERKDSNPMELKNWKFYVVPTIIINEKFYNNKTISLSKVKKLTDSVNYNDLKQKIDEEIKKL